MKFEVFSGYEEYCKPTYLCESDDPEIVRLAEEITKNKKTPEEAANALFQWVRDNIRYEIIKVVGAKKIIQKKLKYAMSFDKTNLFIALCRAIGIPSRYVELSCRMKAKIRQDIAKTSLHIVAEVYVGNKWQIADATFSKDTEKLMDVSEFGKPTYVEIYKEKKMTGLSRFKMMIVNFLIPRMKLLKELKKVLEEIRKS